MLEGFDKDWIASGTRNYANYTNIPPGKYIFKVRGTNSSGKWSKNNPSMKIVIKAPPFKSFYALYSLCCGSSDYFLFNNHDCEGA